MKKYSVRYYECYEGNYEIEANSKEEAECILLDRIENEKENPPEQCYDSGCEIKEIN